MNKLRKELGIDDWLELVKEDQNLNGAYISFAQYIYILENQLKQRDEVIDEARKEIKNIQEHYHELIMKDYKQEDSVFVNKCCKTGFILNVKSYFDLIELILNKYKGDNNE